MSDLDRIECGERVVSMDPEDEGAAGEVVATGASSLKIKWDDGRETWTARQGTVRREDTGLTLDQLNDFELQALRLTLPLELAHHFDAVCAAARREVIGRIARDEVSRSGDEMELRDRVAALVTIFLRDAIVLAGGDDTVGALDDLAVRAEFLEAAAQLTETAMLAPIDEIDLVEASNEQIRAAIGGGLFAAAAAKVINAHRAYRRIERAIAEMPTLG
jgi:hypothetical protein